MEKIIVTEDQAKVIEDTFKSFDHKYKVSMLTYMKDRVDLDLVTIARIVEGEPYEVKREFEVGDVVLNRFTNEPYILMPNDSREGIRQNYVCENDSFVLVCKAENREDK